MKKYNKPEIVTLALDTVDVIETSVETTGVYVAQAELQTRGYNSAVSLTKSIDDMKDTWNW